MHKVNHIHTNPFRSEVPKIATTTENPPTKLTSTETDSSKKRPHVGDETLEVQPKAKKVDTKDES